MPVIGALAPGTGLGMTLALEVALFIIDGIIDGAANGGGIALPATPGRTGIDGVMLGVAGLLGCGISKAAVVAGACMVAVGRVGVALATELVEKAMLLDKKFSTSCSCAAENESNFSSIFSKDGWRGSRWALSVCFSFPNGSMIV